MNSGGPQRGLDSSSNRTLSVSVLFVKVTVSPGLTTTSCLSNPVPLSTTPWSAASALAGRASRNRARNVVARRRTTGGSLRLEIRFRAGSASAADGGHGARRLPEALLAYVVLQLLAPHRVADQALDLLIRGPRPQRPAQVGLVKREEAGARLALGGQGHAGAVGAERVPGGVDEADLALSVGEAEDARGRGRLPRELLQRVDGMD